MCGRTSLFLPQAVVESRFDASAREPIEPRYNIAPFDDLPVITNEEPEVIDQFQWGFLPAWADGPDDTYRPINARAETAAEKPMFRDAFEARRCLVLADGFYEWQDQAHGPSQPYRVQREDEQPFAMAGLWSRWSENGDTIDTVTIITTDANEAIEPIHDRMPVILPESTERDWIEAGGEGEANGEGEAYWQGEGADAGDILQPYPEDDLSIYPISRAVNDPKNDSAAVIEPVEPDTSSQAGLDEFG
jgi:putative SOS response-associated peptidase YedK